MVLERITGRGLKTKNGLVEVLELKNILISSKISLLIKINEAIIVLKLLIHKYFLKLEIIHENMNVKMISE